MLIGRETMAAAELTGDRRLGDQARFWLGRTYAAADRFDGQAKAGIAAFIRKHLGLQ